ncbi:hypothetical protein FHG87_004642 [Trinorchestia longiramus]|nr:hypothetical protein FHG87_004642 [Trinorchestia longiramus]
MKKRHDPTEHHEKMRAERNRHILNEIGQGTLPNLVFTDENKFNFQNPDLNISDFPIWSILETRVLATLHISLESLKAEPQSKYEVIPQEQLRAASDAFVNRLKDIAHNKDGYIEKVRYGIVS